MNSQDERLGSLLAFSDIALVLSTYGVLLAFNYFVEPINTNTWIVFTFFVGIKILIEGIADITGIGKSVWVSMLFVVIADGLIILVNQLMAFGLSLRLLLIMSGVDIIVILVAVLLWKSFAKEEYHTTNENPQTDWVYEQVPNQTSNFTEENIPSEEEEKSTAPSEKHFDIDTETINTTIPNNTTEDVFDFGPLKEDKEEDIQKDIFETEQILNNINSNEPVSEGEVFINFAEITHELPTEEEIEKELALSKLPLENINEEEILATTNTEESENKEETHTSITDLFKANINETVPEDKVKEEQEETTVEPVEVKPEETVIEPEVEVTTEPVETETVKEEVIPTEPIEIEEPTVDETPVLTEEETEQVEEIPVETVSEVVEEPEETIEEVKPFFVETTNDFKEITGSNIGFIKHFNPISINVTPEEIKELRDIVKFETSRLNDNLNKLFEAYNDSLSPEQSDLRVKTLTTIDDSDSLLTSDRIVRNKIKLLIDKQFVSDDLIHSIIELTNKLNNRSYSIDVAEDNLNERIELDRQRELEQNKVSVPKIEEKPAVQEVKTTPVLKNNEVHLQNDDLDIIIDAADLELLKEFLAQQESNN